MIELLMGALQPTGFVAAPFVQHGGLPLGLICTVVFVGIPLVIGLFLFTRKLDRSRIEASLRQRGCQLVLFEHSFSFVRRAATGGRLRFYRVVWRDSKGDEYAGTCSTSVWGGVWFSEERLVSSADDPPRANRPAPARRRTNPTVVAAEKRRLRELEEENARLRAQIEQQQPAVEPPALPPPD